MRFIRHLIRALREATISYNYDLLSDTEHGWTDDDTLFLTEFMKNGTGRKLKIRLMNYVIRCAVEATRQVGSSEYHNGLARGVALCVSAIDQHTFASSPRSESTSDEQQQASEAAVVALN